MKGGAAPEPQSEARQMGYRTRPALLEPASLEEALETLAALGERGAPLAGATWIMRSPLRNEAYAPTYVSLHRLAELRELTVGDPTHIGAMVTHARLGFLNGALGALGEAARQSAFPAVRNIATVGGNICSRQFPEADLVPALLALDAEVEVGIVGDASWLSLGDYLADNRIRGLGELILRVRLGAPIHRASAFERLTVRASAEYSLASVAVAVDTDFAGIVKRARVVVGSVEGLARTWHAAERALDGMTLGPEAANDCRRVLATEFRAREGLDAPAWYRLAVLPALLSRAVGRLANQSRS